MASTPLYARYIVYTLYALIAVILHASAYLRTRFHHTRNSQNPNGKHGDQAVLRPRSQLQAHQDRDRQYHQQDIGQDVGTRVEVDVSGNVEALCAEGQAVVPAATDRRACEEGQQNQDSRGDDDVGDCCEADLAEGGLWGEAQVEDEHGHFGERVRDAAERNLGVGELRGY